MIQPKNKFDKSRSILQNGYVEYFNDQIHHSITAYVTVIGSEQGDGHLKSTELNHVQSRQSDSTFFDSKAGENHTVLTLSCN
jgi:hypothetical protein